MIGLLFSSYMEYGMFQFLESDGGGLMVFDGLYCTSRDQVLAYGVITADDLLTVVFYYK